MKNCSVICSLAICAALCFSCKSKYDLLLSSNDVPSKYEEAMKLYEAKKYKKAAGLFESLSMLTSGTEKDDTVRFYWALSNYHNSDFITAQANFTSYIEMYPRSSFTSKARFLRIDCYYRATNRYELDQAPTHEAIMEISQYMLEYPESDKISVCRDMLNDLTARLDTKEYENALLYYKMEDYLAARTALKNVLKDKAENMHREHVLYYIAMSAYKYASLSVPSKQKERYLMFVDEYFNFISENPQSAYRKELDELYDRAQKALGKGTSLPTTKF